MVYTTRLWHIFSDIDTLHWQSSDHPTIQQLSINCWKLLQQTHHATTSSKNGNLVLETQNARREWCLSLNTQASEGWHKRNNVYLLEVWGRLKKGKIRQGWGQCFELSLAFWWQWGTRKPVSLYPKVFQNTCLTALCPGLPGWAGIRKVKQSGFYWSKRQWVAVASAGPYASLHLAPDR